MHTTFNFRYIKSKFTATLFFALTTWMPARNMVSHFVTSNVLSTFDIEPTEADKTYYCLSASSMCITITICWWDSQYD